MISRCFGSYCITSQNQVYTQTFSSSYAVWWVWGKTLERLLQNWSRAHQKAQASAEQKRRNRENRYERKTNAIVVQGRLSLLNCRFCLNLPQVYHLHTFIHQLLKHIQECAHSNQFIVHWCSLLNQIIGGSAPEAATDHRQVSCFIAAAAKKDASKKWSSETVGSFAQTFELHTSVPASKLPWNVGD